MKVRIKTWEEMVKEFGQSALGIEVSWLIPFPQSMEDMLPEDRIIILRENPNANKVLHYTWDAPDGSNYACFSPGVIGDILESTEEEMAKFKDRTDPERYKRILAESRAIETVDLNGRITIGENK